MASKKVSIDGMADAIMQSLNEYAETTSLGVKAAVKKTGTQVKKQISSTAPTDTGAYAKSWATKTMRESSNALELTVYSKNRYQLAHLLEHGHAKRGGGRVAARPHIAAAEQAGIEMLQHEIERCVRNG